MVSVIVALNSVTITLLRRLRRIPRPATIPELTVPNSGKVPTFGTCRVKCRGSARTSPAESQYLVVYQLFQDPAALVRNPQLFELSNICMNATNDADLLLGFAAELVTALDGIIAQLIAGAVREGLGGNVPLTFHEVRTASLLPGDGSISMSALATAMGVSLPTASHLVNRLVEKGAAVRIRSDQDRRLVLVALSESAKARRRALFQNRVQVVVGILEPLGPTEREQAVKAIGALARAAQLAAARRGDAQPSVGKGISYDKDKAVDSSEGVS